MWEILFWVAANICIITFVTLGIAYWLEKRQQAKDKAYMKTYFNKFWRD